MECVATGRQLLIDLEFICETTLIQYAGYWAAEEGRRSRVGRPCPAG